MDPYRPKGQVLLITVLVLTIAITVALSLMGRTTSDARMTGQMEESARAFSAAEAGIEDVLKRMSGITATIQGEHGSATFTTQYNTIGESGSAFTYPTLTKKGDVATIWLVPHTSDGVLIENPSSHYCQGTTTCAINICWDQMSPIAAIEAAVVYKNTATNAYALERVAYDPDTARSGNNFTNTGIATSGCGKTSGVHQIQMTLPITNALPLMIRLRPYYNDVTFSVNPTDNRILPAQFFEVSSLGQTESGVSRKIVVKKQYRMPPAVFDHVLYSNNAVTHESYSAE